MHPRVLGQRRESAQMRAVAAAQALAAAAGLDTTMAARLAVYERDPETRQMLRLEAVADLLEALAGSGEEQKGMSKSERAKAENDDLRAQVEDLRDRLKKAEAAAAPAKTRTASK